MPENIGPTFEAATGAGRIAPAAHYWIDRSGSIADRELTDMIVAEALMELDEGQTILVTEFTHCLGPDRPLERLAGDTVESVVDRLRTLLADGLPFGGTDLEPIYERAERDLGQGLDIEHVIVTDGEWFPTNERAERHPASVSYVFFGPHSDGNWILLAFADQELVFRTA